MDGFGGPSKLPSLPPSECINNDYDSKRSDSSVIRTPCTAYVWVDSISIQSAVHDSTTNTLFLLSFLFVVWLK